MGALPLGSTTARVSRAGKLTKAAPGLPWIDMLDRACSLAARAIRAGEPAAELIPRGRERAPYLIEPLIPLGGRPTVLHADGGTGKSLLAMAIALAVARGITLPGLGTPTMRARCLYLDWETDQPTAEARAHLLARGLDVSGEGAIVYRRMVAPLVEDAAAVRRDVVAHGIGIVVIDSLQYAIAGSDRGDVATPYTQAFHVLRSLGPDVTALVLAHHSHAGDDKREAHPYGSRFIHNNCGSRWELRADREEPTDLRPAALLLGLYHRKANDDWLRPPVALRVVFDREGTGAVASVRVEAGQVQDSPVLLERAHLHQRIAFLMNMRAVDTKTVAEKLGITEDVARRTLERYAGHGKKWIRLPNTKPILYGLPSYAHA
jgi:hypothetical protein